MNGSPVQRKNDHLINSFPPVDDADSRGDKDEGPVISKNEDIKQTQTNNVTIVNNGIINMMPL